MLCLHLDAGEHGELTAHHIGRDGDGAPADKVCRTTCEAKLHGAAGAWIWQLTDLITEEAEIGSSAECEADALL